MGFAIGAVSDKGRVKDKNQDRVYINKGKLNDIPYVLACICDGIGSFEKSEISSQMVVDGLRLWSTSLKEGGFLDIDITEIIADLKDTLQEINELIFERKNSENIKLGCTMSLLFLFGRQYEIIHVGDSSAYRISEFVTKITEDETRVSPKDGKIRLINCVGKSQLLSFKSYFGELEKNQGFVLGSDGLFKRMNFDFFRDSFLKIETDNDAVNTSRALIDYVLDKGERDNVSAVIVKSL